MHFIILIQMKNISIIKKNFINKLQQNSQITTSFSN